MLKRFALRNYKNFADDIEIRFDGIAGYKFNDNCIDNGLISKMLIYGRNATGKTNLGMAIMNIYDMIFNNMRYVTPISNAAHINEEVCFSYVFLIDNKEIVYEYTKDSENTLIKERMSVDNSVSFYCEYQTKAIAIHNLTVLGLDNVVTDNFEEMIKEYPIDDENLSRKCFLKWLFSNTAYSNESLLAKLTSFISRMRFAAVSSMLPLKPIAMQSGFFDYLEDKSNLDHFEAFLNEMGVSCRLVLKILPDGNKELYFDYGTLIPFFMNASSGTRALVDLYRMLIFNGTRKASFFYLDEFDAFYHYEMSETVLNYLKKVFPDTQIVITTHNTNLMSNRLMRPDCLFILSRTGSLTALCNATMRELREGHNLEKMYISGEFEVYE